MDRYLRTNLPQPVIGDWATPPEGMGHGQSAGSVNLTGEALRSARAAYYGLINHVDDQINRLLNPVNGIDRMTGGNTIVVFTSDHGEMLGDHYLWRKTVPYEPSARIPLLIRGPAALGLRPRKVVDRPVCLEDVMPTLLDLAGVAIPDTVEGASLAPLTRGEKAEWRQHLHIEHAPMYHTLTDGREKYIWFVSDGREQLFDLTADPTECHDLAPEPGSSDRLAFWRRRLVDELRDRPEGFTDGDTLVPGCSYPAVLDGKPERISRRIAY